MTLFDTSVVIDARDADSPWHEWAKEQIAGAGAVEAPSSTPSSSPKRRAALSNVNELLEDLERMGLSFAALPVSAAIPASEAYALYRSRLKGHGKPPPSKIPLGDFFIGAHAAAEGMRLVTRDPDRIRTYFPAVKLNYPKN